MSFLLAIRLTAKGSKTTWMPKRKGGPSSSLRLQKGQVS
jgi:hypothetical protein